MQALRHFLLAVQFFSRIPVTGRLAAWVGWSPAMQRASAAHLPGVGWLVGGAAAGIMVLCHYALAPHPMLPWVAAALSTVATLALTGAFHEDGLADVADGLGGHLPATRALEVMKDSRLGAYGAITLCMALITKLVLLALLVSIDMAAAALLACSAHVLSRGAPLWLMRLLPHVSLPATAKTLHIAGSPLTWRGLCTGMCWCLPALAAVYVYLGWITVVVLLLTCAATAAYMGWRFHQRLGGMTGDCLGACQQMCEVAMYLVAGFVLASYVI